MIEHGKGEVSGSIYKLSGKLVGAPTIDEITATVHHQLDHGKVSENLDVFQLSTLYAEASLDDGEGEEAALLRMTNEDAQPMTNPDLLKISKSNGESSSNSPASYTFSLLSSESDDLDSDLVKAAIERLDIEDSQVCC